MSAIVENAVGGLIASEVHGVIGLLVSRINEEIKLAWGFKKELEKLKDEFEVLSGILEGTSRQSVSNKVMDGWLEKIKDVAEDVNILLDECSYKALEDKIRPQKCYKKLFRRHGMAHKVSDVTKAIDSIYNHAHKLGIKPADAAGGGDMHSGMHSHEIEKQESKLQVRLVVDDKSLLGREEDITKIVESLRDAANSHSDLNVIGIVGMAGTNYSVLILLPT